MIIIGVQPYNTLNCMCIVCTRQVVWYGTRLVPYNKCGLYLINHHNPVKFWHPLPVACLSIHTYSLVAVV